MKKLLFILTSLAMSICIMAQETSKQKEVGLIFYNFGFESLGITYRTGSDRSLWRFQTLVFKSSFDNQDRHNFGPDFQNPDDDSTLKTKRRNFSAVFKLGKEARNKLTDKLEFRYGADLSFRYNYSYQENKMKSENELESTNETKNIRYEPGVNVVLGLNYLISDRIFFGVEILPGISYRSTTNERESENSKYETEMSSIRFSSSSSSVLLSLAYRF